MNLSLTKSLISLGLISYLLFPLDAFSQKKVTRISQQWIQSYHEVKLNQRWSALLDGGFRWREGFAEPTAYIVRGGIGYSLLPNLRVASGFSHLGLYAKEHVNRQEFRPHQEILYKSTLGKINLSQRLRLEERFLKLNPFRHLFLNWISISAFGINFFWECLYFAYQLNTLIEK